jgi:tetratricopeptide (TPR) repeat protein
MTVPAAHLVDMAAQARAALASGRLDEARKHFGAAMARTPRDAMLLVEAAVVEGQLGDLKAAERLLDKALKLDPNNADAWYNLGQVARAKDQLERAVRLFRKTLAIDPEYNDAAFGLGEALYCQGKAAEALVPLAQATRRAPDDAEIVHVTALCLDHLGKTGPALAAYRQVLRLQPGHGYARLNLAVLTTRVGDPLEALDLFGQVETSTGVQPETFALAAQILHHAGEPDRALAYVDKALAAGLHPAEATTTRANVLIERGDFDGAEADLHKVLKLKKDSAWAYNRLAAIRRLRPGAERPLLRQAQDGSAPALTRIAAFSALYHLYAQNGDHERAFEMLASSNALKSAEAPFDVRQDEAYCQRIIETYSPQHLARMQPSGFDRPGPVFIFGMPRSGTTLTEQILAAHPDVFARGERGDVHRIVTRTPGWPETALSLDAASLHEQGREIHDIMFAAAEGRPMATDKTPGHYTLVGAIVCTLPRAKLVYVRRQPGDNALSLYEQIFLRGLNFSYDLGQIGAVYRHHQRIMQHWIETCGLPIHTVDYDRLVQDPEPHIRRLLDFVGLDFRPECLTPHRVERSVNTSSVWQVRQPISAKSVGRWRRYERQLEPFFKALESA